MIELEANDGHMILYAKGWYDVDEVTYIQGAGVLQAAYCGWSAHELDEIPYEGLADRLHRILVECLSPYHLENLMPSLHRHMMHGTWRMFPDAKDKTPIEITILFYLSKLQNLQIRDTKNEETMIKLPKPQKRKIKTLLRGKKPFTLEMVKDL